MTTAKIKALRRRLLATDLRAVRHRPEQSCIAFHA